MEFTNLDFYAPIATVVNNSVSWQRVESVVLGLHNSEHGLCQMEQGRSDTWVVSYFDTSNLLCVDLGRVNDYDYDLPIVWYLDLVVVIPIQSTRRLKTLEKVSGLKTFAQSRWVSVSTIKVFPVSV